MKSREVKYREATERNLSLASSASAVWRKKHGYPSSLRAKQILGIRAADASYDFDKRFLALTTDK